jgi:hypothetical protein
VGVPQIGHNRTNWIGKACTNQNPEIEMPFDEFQQRRSETKGSLPEHDCEVPT